MHVQAVIPFKPKNPKTRLSCILDQDEREAFARAMLDDVIDAVAGAGCDAALLCTEPFTHRRIPTIVREEGLNESINWFLGQSAVPVLIVMADLPLITPSTITGILSTGSEVALAPGRGGGTNAIYIRSPGSFYADFYGASFLDHLAIAKVRGLSCEIVDSYRLSTDIDEKEDLVEILIHGTGKSRMFLENLGFSLSVEKGRVGVQRDTHKQAL